MDNRRRSSGLEILIVTSGEEEGYGPVSQVPEPEGNDREIMERVELGRTNRFLDRGKIVPE